LTLVDVRFGLAELLTSNASINAIVNGRVFPVLMPQGETRDSVTYTRITELESYKMDGPSGLIAARFQFDAWAQSIDNAQVLADLVKECLGGFAGQIQFAPPDYVNVQAIFLIDGRDDYDGVAQMHRMSRDYSVWYEDRNS